MSELRRLWLEHPQAAQAWLPACLEAEANRALTDDGDNEAAFDLAEIGKSLAANTGYPSQELERLQAVALARAGATHEARRRIKALVDDPDRDPGALGYGVLARTYRDLAQAEEDPEERTNLFLTAAEWAEKGWRRAAPADPESAQLGDFNDAAYLANQAAQFSLLGGDNQRSKRFQREVQTTWEQLETLHEEWFPLDDTSQFWWSTNLAEMAVLGGDLDAAARHYRRMREIKGMLGHVVANAKVCRTLLVGTGREATEMEDILSLPSITVFSGHMFDRPDRENARFPADWAEPVKQRLRETLDELECTEGFVSASAGSDLLFAEALLERQGRLHLVLPFSQIETLKTCVEPWGEPWIKRFTDVFQKAYRVKELEWPGISGGDNPTLVDHVADDASTHYAYANQVMLGLARLRADGLDLDLQPVTVWDQSDAGNPPAGGAGDFTRVCRELGLEPMIVSPQPPMMP